MALRRMRRTDQRREIAPTEGSDGNDVAHHQRGRSRQSETHGKAQCPRDAVVGGGAVHVGKKPDRIEPES